MARGRSKRAGSMHDANVINKYLDAVRARNQAPNVNTERIKEKIELIANRLVAHRLTGVQRLKLIQRQRELGRQLEAWDQDLEDEFIKVVKGWADYNEVEYGSFRLLGVTDEVLRKAGIEP